MRTPNARSAAFARRDGARTGKENHLTVLAPHATVTRLSLTRKLLQWQRVLSGLADRNSCSRTMNPAPPPRSGRSHSRNLPCPPGHVPGPVVACRALIHTRAMSRYNPRTQMFNTALKRVHLELRRACRRHQLHLHFQRPRLEQQQQQWPAAFLTLMLRLLFRFRLDLQRLRRRSPPRRRWCPPQAARLATSSSLLLPPVLPQMVPLHSSFRRQRP